MNGYSNLAIVIDPRAPATELRYTLDKSQATLIIKNVDDIAPGIAELERVGAIKKSGDSLAASTPL